MIFLKFNDKNYISVSRIEYPLLSYIVSAYLKSVSIMTWP